jgi:hypothetical protein
MDAHHVHGLYISALFVELFHFSIYVTANLLTSFGIPDFAPSPIKYLTSSRFS